MGLQMEKSSLASTAVTTLFPLTPSKNPPNPQPLQSSCDLGQPYSSAGWEVK